MRVPQVEAMRLAVPALAVFGLVLDAGVADAACNLIPGTTKTFSATLGTTNRPFAAPGESLEVASPNFAANATDHVVTVVFTPPHGPHNVVIVAADCAALEAGRQTCEARSDVDTATCLQVDPATDPQALSFVTRDGVRHLSFRFPDTDAILAPASDDRTLSGPATIAISLRTDPLPCALSSTPCSAETAPLVACIDDFFVDDGAGGTVPNTTFSHFTALPPPNDYGADCFTQSPPCLASGSEFRFAVDEAGNFLAPMDWRGILVREGQVPVPRLLRATFAPPIPIRLPGRAFSASYTPEGGLLPPIFEPQADPNAPSNVLTLFGSADAPYTILRIARRVGRCTGGGPNDGQACTSFEDCPGGTCPTTCVRGANDGAFCSGDGDCPGGTCGSLFDLSGFAFAGTGPVVLPRRGSGVCQQSPHPSCTTDAECSGAGNLCVLYAFEAQTPVPLEGLVQTSDVFAFVVSEAIEGRDLNGDGDVTDSVVTLTKRDTGELQPIGNEPACGIVGSPEGRAVTRIAQPPFSFPAVAVEGDVVAFLENEPLENYCDENGDGDVFDTILRVFRLGPMEVTAGMNLAVDAAPLLDDRSLAVSNGLVFFRASEAAAARQSTTRVSIASGGTQGNGSSMAAAISGDGRFVAFAGTASNLVPGDTNGASDVFVHDRQTGETTRVSVASDGTQGDGASDIPAISGDGRFVAFRSGASHLVPGDTNGTLDIFVHDRQTGATTRVSVASDGTQADGASNTPAISRDGRFVAFESLASNLVTGDTNATLDIFVRDLQTGQTTRVSVASDGTQANSASNTAAISADGRFVAFTSLASNLVAGDTNGALDVFVHDRESGETTIASVASDGTLGNGSSSRPSLSADGRFVAFTSSASNLVAGDTNSTDDVFVHDRQTGETTRVSVASDGTQSNGLSLYQSISADGRFVVFPSAATNLVPGDTNAKADTFIHDLLTGETARVSVATDGTQGNGDSGVPNISGDGRFVAFESDANTLVPGDTNGSRDVFVHGPDATDCVHDLTGNCDLAETVLQVVDAGSGVVTSLCPADAVSVADGNAAFLRPEAAGNAPGCPPGPDLNGDGDTQDEVVHLSLAAGPSENLQCAATAVSLSTDWLAALVSETDQGAAGTDLNGDGDTLDDVVEVHRVSDGAGACAPPTWRNLGQAADVVEVSGSIVAFITPEAAQGGADLNGDGDAADRVLQLYDAAAGTLIRPGLAAEEFVLGSPAETLCGRRQLIAFRTSEAAQGGQDLNGDGDVADDVMNIYDAETRTLFPTGRAVTPCRLEACDPRLPYRVFGSKVKFLTLEADQGGRDLNGDGDASDLVLESFDVCTRELKVIGAVDPSSGMTGDPLAEEDGSEVVVTTAGRCAANGMELLVPGSCLRIGVPGTAPTGECPPGTTCEPTNFAVVAASVVPTTTTMMPTSTTTTSPSTSTTQASTTTTASTATSTTTSSTTTTTERPTTTSSSSTTTSTGSTSTAASSTSLTTTTTRATTTSSASTTSTGSTSTTASSTSTSTTTTTRATTMSTTSTTGSTTTTTCPSACINSGVGRARDCTVLALGGGKVDVTGPAGGIAGDLCVGPNGKLSITGSQFVTGSIRLATGATLSKSGPGSIRAVLRNTDLMPEISDAISAARRDGALPCTQTFASLDTSRVIAGAGGTNVICVGDLTLNGGEVVALRGGASDTFVVNVTGRFALTGGSRLVASGVAPSAILYDVIGDGPQVHLSGGGGGERCCRASVDGTVIALGRDIALAPARVNGEVIGGRNISIVGGASVGCQACP